MNEPLIRVRDLTMGWDERVLLERVSFDVPSGDLFVILGGSGCGKSTLLRHLIGLEAPMAGVIEIGGRSSTLRDGEAPAFGVMFQSGALFSSMTVGDNVGFPLHEWTTLPAEAIEAVVRAKLSLVGLDGAHDKLPSELSGGMKKRAAIARAMAFEPELIFLDEPSAGLDPVSAAELDELILVLNKTLGLTVVMVTHELASIEKVGKNCIMLDQETRSIIARGEPRVLAACSEDRRVQRFFRREAN
jgi:phospholipid/cholesterol/gamma-HCH transport system ATP-binding protein